MPGSCNIWIYAEYNISKAKPEKSLIRGKEFDEWKLDF